jgi:ribonuclease HII
VDLAERVKLHDDLLAQMPEGARHDQDICPFCVDKAAQTGASTTSDPSRSGGADVSETETSRTHTQEGGTPATMSDSKMISEETHSALLEKAVADAVAATTKALETKTEEASAATGKVTELTTERDQLKGEVDRLNTELDKAQVELKAKTDEVASLKTAADEQAKEVEKASVASKRADEVKGLGLFSDDYVVEKASSWADLSTEDWAARLDEWKQLKPASAASADDKAKAYSRAAPRWAWSLRGYSRNSFENIVRDGRFRVPATGTAFKIGAPVMIDAANPGRLKVATEAAAPGPNCGLVVFEHIQNKSDALTLTFDDSPYDLVPLGVYAQMMHGVGTKVWFANTGQQDPVRRSGSARPSTSW